METLPLSRVRRRCARAFTLVELLVVMVIIVIVTTLVAPSVRGVLDGFNLTGSADNVMSTLTLARQTAMARNLPVEVRIYQRDTGRGRSDWNTLALLIPSTATSGKAADGSTVPAASKVPDVWISTPSNLSGNVVVIDSDDIEDKSFSTLIAKGKQSPISIIDEIPAPQNVPWSFTETTRATTSVTPKELLGKKYVAFWFLPDGSTNLPLPATVDPSAPTTIPKVWMLTLRNFNASPAPSTGSGASTLPAKNFVTMVIDPMTGRALTYRP